MIKIQGLSMSCDYEAHPSGRIWSNKTNRFLKPSDNGRGYQHVVLRIDGKSVDTYVHRFIAENLIANPERFSEVNHINGNKEDNSVGNLEWVSSSMNKDHAVRSGLRKIKAIIAINPSTQEVVGKYSSAREGAIAHNTSWKNIQQVCLGSKKTSAGLIWRYQPFTEI